MPGADINAYSDLGETRLLLACRLARTDIIIALVALGADPNLREAVKLRGRIAYPLGSSGWGQPHSYADPAEPPAGSQSAQSWGRTALVVLLQRTFPDISLIKLLLDAGADPSAADSGFSTPMVLAVRRGAQQPLRLLLDAGGDPNQPDSQGSTPLKWAAHEGQPECMALLLERGARMDLVDAAGCPPLLLAAQRGDCPTLSLLLAAGAAPGARNKFGRSALSLAAERGHPEACELLLAAGADPDDGGKACMMGTTARTHLERLGLRLDDRR